MRDSFTLFFFVFFTVEVCALAVPLKKKERKKDIRLFFRVPEFVCLQV